MPVFGPVTVIGHFQPIILFLSSIQIFNSTGKTVSFMAASAQRKCRSNHSCEANGKLSKCWKKWCPGWESNPHEEKSPEDFKSSASAIPPPGRWHYKFNQHARFLQHARKGQGSSPVSTTRTTSGLSRNDPPQYSAFPQFAFLPRKPPAAGIAPCSMPAAWRCQFPGQTQIPPVSAPLGPTPVPESFRPDSRNAASPSNTASHTAP